MNNIKENSSMISIFSKGYGSVGKLVMQDKELNIYAKAIYAYLMSFAGNGDNCFPSRELIASDLGISRNIVSKYIKELIDNSYLRVEQSKKCNGNFSNNIYHINYYPLKHSTLSEPLLKVHCQITPNNNNIYNNNILSDNSDVTQKTVRVTWETVYNNTDNKYADIINKFDELWELYGKVGSKKLAFKQWYKLTDEQKEKAYDNVPDYFSSLNDLKYKKHMERYISQELYLQEFISVPKTNTLFGSTNTAPARKRNKLN